MIYKYTFICVGGNNINFTSSANIDFFKISNTAIAFDELYINMSNVVCIRKEIIEDGGAECQKIKS